VPINPSVIFQFGAGNQGWSERYWAVGSSSLQQVAQWGTDLLEKRVMLMGRGVTCLNAFATYDDVFRDVWFIAKPSPNKEGIWNPLFGDEDPDQPNAVIILRCRSGDRAGKVIYLSGCPDIDIQFPPGRPPQRISAAWLAAFVAFRIELVLHWGWKGLSYDPVISPIFDVTAITGPATAAVFAGVSTGAFEKGKRMKLTGAKFLNGIGAREINRVYTITDVDIGNSVTGVADTVFPTYTYLGQGKMQVQNYTILPIQTAVLDKIGTRKRGVGASPPRGRRRT